jgi:hypothetical protein
MKVLSGRFGELSAAIAGLAALFILKFAFL